MTSAEVIRPTRSPAAPARFAADARRRAIVGTMKLVLPLAGLALLSSVFLLSERVDPERALPLARVDVEALARLPRIDAPRFAAMTAEGSAISVVAGSVRSDSGGGRVFTADEVTATLETPDGQANIVTARTGVIDRTRETMDLTGGVRVITASGHEVHSDRLTGRLDRTLLISPGPVTARAPGSTITADRMELRRLDSETPKGRPAYGVVFSGSVRLLYDPRAEE